MRYAVSSLLMEDCIRKSIKRGYVHLFIRNNRYNCSRPSSQDSEGGRSSPLASAATAAATTPTSITAAAQVECSRSIEWTIAESILGCSPSLTTALHIVDFATGKGEVIYQNMASLTFYRDLRATDPAAAGSSEILLRHMFSVEGDALLMDMLLTAERASKKLVWAYY